MGNQLGGLDIKEHLGGILGLVIGLALLPVVMNSINQAKAMQEIAQGGTVATILDIVPLIYVVGLLVAVVYSFIK